VSYNRTKVRLWASNQRYSAFSELVGQMVWHQYDSRGPVCSSVRSLCYGASSQAGIVRLRTSSDHFRESGKRL